LRIFLKSVEKIQASLKSEKNKGYFILEDQNIFLSYLAHFSSEYKMFQTNVVEKVKTYFVLSTFSSEIMSFMRKCGKIL